MRFSLHFHEFLTILSLSIFFSKISTDISDISVKSKYQYIRNYRYFHPWLSLKVDKRDCHIGNSSCTSFILLLKLLHHALF